MTVGHSGTIGRFFSSAFPSPPNEGEGGVKVLRGIIIALVYLCQLLKRSCPKRENIFYLSDPGREFHE